MLVTVDDQNPQPGDSVEFTLDVRNLNNDGRYAFGEDNSIVGVEVQVRLAPGLEFASGWAPNPSQGTSSRKRIVSSGTWKVGDILITRPQVSPDARTVEIEAVLTTESLGAIPLEERCISAWVSDMTPPPDPGYPPSSLTACLGDDPPVLFESGTIGPVHRVRHVSGLVLAHLARPCMDTRMDDGSERCRSCSWL